MLLQQGNNAYRRVPKTEIKQREPVQRWHSATHLLNRLHVEPWHLEAAGRDKEKREGSKEEIPASLSQKGYGSQVHDRQRELLKCHAFPRTFLRANGVPQS